MFFPSFVLGIVNKFIIMNVHNAKPENHVNDP